MNVRFIEDNKRGALGAVFCVNDEWYFADIVYLPYPYDCNECMIFKSDEHGNVTDWSDQYCNRDPELTISKESMLTCIREFCDCGYYEDEDELD